MSDLQDASPEQPVAVAEPPGAVAPPLEPTVDSPRGLSGKITALFVKAGKRGFWPLADQGIASVGNILTIIVVGAALTKRDFGRFTLALEFLFFMVSLHAAVVTYPLTIKGAIASDETLRKLSTAALIATLMIGIPVLLVGALVGFEIHLYLLLIVAGLSLMLWQAQETVRRALMAHFRHREAVVGDAISYLGQVLCLYILAKTGRLTLITAIGSIGVTSLLSLLVQAWQVGLIQVSFAEVIDTCKSFWAAGRWVALTNLSALSLMACGNWALAKFHGTEQVANYAAVGALLKVCNPVIQSVGGLIVPASAAALGRGGVQAARRISIRMSGMAALVLAPFMLLLVIAPRFCLQLTFHGKYSSDEHCLVLRFFVLGYAIVFITTMLTSFLNGVHRPRFTFYGQVVGSIGMFVILLPLVIKVGWLGYSIGGILQGLLQIAVLGYFATRVTTPTTPSLVSASPLPA